jgi:prepilin-type N-terminal cleavage/methylation domain-containing protein
MLKLFVKNFANRRRVGLSNNRSGFSLIELAAVILIIGILIADCLIKKPRFLLLKI